MFGTSNWTPRVKMYSRKFQIFLLVSEFPGSTGVSVKSPKMKSNVSPRFCIKKTNVYALIAASVNIILFFM